MRIEEGHLLKFVPPILAGDSYNNKKRYMLVIKNDEENNTIEMINVSSIKGKESKLLYDSNIEIKSYKPLPVPTFAKLDTLYIIDNFDDLQNFVSFNGVKINNLEIANIKMQRYDYIKNHNQINVINFSEFDFKKFNL